MLLANTNQTLWIWKCKNIIKQTRFHVIPYIHSLMMGALSAYINDNYDHVSR